MNPYEILGVTKAANDSDIKKAYRKLAAKHHPDRGGDENKFKQINEAYSLISTEQKRQQYEYSNSAHSNFGDIFGNFGSVFEDLFGTPKPKSQPKVQKDQDLVFDMRISLDQIKKGATQRFSYKRNKKCVMCDGVGGAERTACRSCGGTGRKVIQSGHLIRQTVCRECFGNGIIIKNPCGVCHGRGSIQVIEHINIQINEL
tara:strand:+ start:221 stop:823 length:603 start_codon:yes stop_codon:yes gene_type:complete